MLHNYIPDYRKSDGEKLQLFMYVAGGFKRTFEAKLRELASQAGLIGLGILAQSLLEIVYWAQSHPDRKPLIRNKIIKFPESKVVFMDDFIEES